MATNKQQPIGISPFEIDSVPYVDPNDIMGEEVTQPKETSRSWIDVTKEALNKATAEADADAISAALPQPEEDQRQANINAVKSRGQQQAAAQANNIARQPVNTGMPVKNQDQLPGQLWSGQAGYAEGTAPRIVRLGNGQMMSEVGGVWSFVKDEKEAAFIIGVDKEQSDVQLKRQKYRIQEAQLEAALDAMTASTTTFKTFNRKLLTDMVGELADYPPEVAEKLRGLYEDEGLLDGLYQLPPNEFVQSLNQLRDMLLGGETPRNIASYANQSRSRGSQTKNQYISEADLGFGELLREYSSDIDEAERRLQELEDQKRKYLTDDESLMDPSERATSVNSLFGDAIISAQKNLQDARSNYQRVNTRRDSLRSQIGSEFDPSSYGGTNSIDGVYNSKAYRGRISKYGGTVWSIMDLVARDSGFGDGLNTPGFKAQLADPEQAAMFIAECQRKAVLNGWSTESVEPWVNGLAQHVLGSPDAGEIANLVNAAMRMQQDAKFDIGQEAMGMKQQQAGGGGVDGSSLLNSPEFQSTLSPSVRDVLNSGYRPPEGSAESAEAELNILLAAEADGMSEEDVDALNTAYKSMPEMEPGKGGAVDNVVTSEDTAVLKEGIPRADILTLQRSGREDYVNSLVKLLGNKLPAGILRYAMDPDGVFDKDRSDQAWEQVKDAAMEMSKENLGTDEKPKFMSLEDIEIALDLLEKKRDAEDLHPLDDPLRIDPRSYR